VFVKPPAAPPHTQTAAATPALAGDLTRLLGNDPPPPAAPEAEAAVPTDARFQLIGVVSPPARAAAREGVALIAIDGQPPKAYKVGAVVEGDTVLQNVAARGVTLGPRNGPPLVALNLPPPAPPATGSLPALGAGMGGAGVAGGYRTPGAPMSLPAVMPIPEAQDNNDVLNQADNQPVR
jgi:general secretion pathway protein C